MPEILSSSTFAAAAHFSWLFFVCCILFLTCKLDDSAAPVRVSLFEVLSVFNHGGCHQHLEDPCPVGAEC